MKLRINNSISYILPVLLGTMMFFIACEEIDDGSFTPQVIFDPGPPPDTTFTVEDPCLSTSCALRTMDLDAGSDTLTMDFYSNYDFMREDAIWGTLTSAVIVVHGNLRNGNEYFSWLTNALLSINKQNETLLIAPNFKTSNDVSTGDPDIIYSSDGWKRGFQSNNITSEKIASYTIMDSVLKLLADKSRFPNLEKIIITGHSAGAQFTNLYAAASPMPDQLAGIDVEYLVANSQYFFYPGPERWNGSSFVVPTGCNNYDNWPYGTGNLTAYLSDFTEQDIRDRYTGRKLTYLLGTLDIFTGGSLNTSDCEATLLGENRFVRGQNMVRYMGDFFSNSEHIEILVNNVGHDAAAMYNSTVGKQTILDMLGG
ncbi:MAG: hypothetical protein MRZ79_23725 [Bacteroidia bacterium]|nr:hypothetical protein [Bacteroidia bacterium]